MRIQVFSIFAFEKYFHKNVWPIFLQFFFIFQIFLFTLVQQEGQYGTVYYENSFSNQSDHRYLRKILSYKWPCFQYSFHELVKLMVSCVDCESALVIFHQFYRTAYSSSHRLSGTFLCKLLTSRICAVCLHLFSSHSPFILFL